MSLINQMLKDLEKRSNAEKPSATPLPPKAAPVAVSRRYRKVLWSAVPLLSIGAGVVWFMNYGIPRVVVNGTGETGVAQVFEPEDAAAMAPSVEEKPASDPVHEQPATLEMLRFAQRGERLQVEIDFSSVPAYGLTRGGQGSQLVLDLPGGMMGTSLPNTAGFPLLRSVASHGRATGLQLIFSFNQEFRYEELLLAENPSGRGKTLRFVVQPEAAVSLPAVLQSGPDKEKPPVTAADRVQPEKHLQAPAPVGPKPEQSLVRQEVQISPRARATKCFLDAGTALQQGRQREAETALHAALALDPGHVEARNLLLRLLVQQNRRTDIRSLLVEGIGVAPQYLPYRVQYARLLIEDGMLSQAREQLTREPRPTVIEAPDLYAMLATVYQRQGQYTEAAQTYRALLAVKPEQAVWWMGLGIALEGATLEDQAQQAYRQAISRGGLSDGLQTFIRKRMAVLGSRGAQTPADITSVAKEQS